MLRRGDVLTHLDGVAIADDGTFLFREAVRIDFRHIASCAFDGDAVTGGVWRDGKQHLVQVVLRVPQQLVPAHSHDHKPEYLIFAGARAAAGAGTQGARCTAHDCIPSRPRSHDAAASWLCPKPLAPRPAPHQQSTPLSTPPHSAPQA